MVKKIGMGQPTAIRWNIPDHWVDELQSISERTALNIDKDGQRAKHSARERRAAAVMIRWGSAYQRPDGVAGGQAGLPRAIAPPPGLGSFRAPRARGRSPVIGAGVFASYFKSDTPPTPTVGVRIIGPWDSGGLEWDANGR